MKNTLTLDEVLEGVAIGKNYLKRPVFLRIIVGIPLIYLPILSTIPFVFIGVHLVRWHLWCLGATNMKRYRDFVPAWVTHRYTYADQPTSTTTWFASGYFKWTWIFNCKVYCPMSIALLRYAVYLVKIVENWWCPFTHERKQEYAESRIDYSYWHTLPGLAEKLHPEDRNNPMWNKDAAR